MCGSLLLLSLIDMADLFQRLELRAREQQRGMWITAEPTPETPEVQQPVSGSGYVASKSSEVFHIPSCTWAKRIAEGNEVYFRTFQEAVDSGRRPCKVCKPEDTTPLDPD